MDAASLAPRCAVGGSPISRAQGFGYDDLRPLLDFRRSSLSLDKTAELSCFGEGQSDYVFLALADPVVSALTVANSLYCEASPYSALLESQFLVTCLHASLANFSRAASETHWLTDCRRPYAVFDTRWRSFFSMLIVVVAGSDRKHGLPRRFDSTGFLGMCET